MKNRYAIFGDTRDDADDSDGITLVCYPIPFSILATLKNSRVIKEFEADSWDEARQVQYDYYGWGEYKPMTTQNIEKPKVMIAKDHEGNILSVLLSRSRSHAEAFWNGGGLFPAEVEEIDIDEVFEDTTRVVACILTVEYGEERGHRGVYNKVPRKVKRGL
jgi:hypothetical protein